MDDITPVTWVDSAPGGAVELTDENMNTEVRNSYLLLLNPPTCQVTRATNQVVGSGTYFSAWTAISWSSAVFDTEAPDDPMFAIGAPTRVTCRTAGWYELVVVAEGTGIGATQLCTGAVRVNGSVTYLGDTIGLCTDSMHFSVKHLLPLAVADYVEVIVTHDIAGNLTVVGGGDNAATFTISRRRGI